MGKTVLETFTIFPFSIVLALALGEAFKQAVADHRPGATTGGEIQWDRLPALLTFLLLVLPFYQGMNRYLLLTYGGEPAAQHHYSTISLIIDGASFMVESAVFFAMSRNLANSRWQYFYLIVLFLLVVDTLWGLSTHLHPHDQTTPVLKSWMVLNLVFAVIVALLIRFGRGLTDAQTAIVGTVAMFIRTVIDYVLSWDFYFS
jgi:uncharacterized membrane protein